jgi:hypothetical protein
MTSRFSIVLVGASLLSCLSASSAGAAPLLQLDFGSSTSPVQTGFSQVDSSGTVVNGITFTTNGSFFDRGAPPSGSPSFTYSDLYRDFTYVNSGTSPASINLGLSGGALVPNSPYQVTFFSYDSDNQDGNHVVTLTGAAGTSGTASVSYAAGAAISSNDEFAGTGLFFSNASGALNFTGTDSFTNVTDAGGTGIRIDGLIVSSVPEPSQMVALCGLGVAGLLIVARRHRKA